MKLPMTDLFSKKDLDDLQMAMLRRRAERFSRGRLISGPVMAVILLLTLVGDGAVWRRWVLGAMAVLLILRSVAEVFYSRRERARTIARTKPPSAVAGIFPPLGVGIFVLATGGFDSPMLPLVLPMAFFIGTLTEPRLLRTLVATSIVLVVALVVISTRGWIPDLVPAVLGGAHVSQPAALAWAKAAALIAMLGWGAMGSSLVRYVFRQIAGDALDARDEVLANHDEHIRELTALSGEIAHELKNPLANIKGLATLVGRDVQGRAAERVGVLLHEVDRMEGILQEFLTFSRPLVPLNEEGVDLEELCQNVVALHEGLAHSRNIALVVRQDGPVRANGDPRKLKQVLINLVQNALDASPRGGTVELVLSPGPDGGGRLEVRDAGTGLSAEIQAHLFEPGITTKERGSGLGLALARGLARQHGGDLALQNREEGGCVATLTLPAAPPLAARVIA